MKNSPEQINLSTFFDYESLDQVHRLVIQEHTGEIRKRLRRSAQDVWEIGQLLSDVRSRLKYGQFLIWLKAEFGWSQRAAYNFINVYETFGDRFAKLAKVDIATSVLYQLAAPSVPEKLRTQVLEAAEAGEKITHKSIKFAIKQSKEVGKPAASSATISGPSQPKAKKPEIITVISQSSSAIEGPASAHALTNLKLMPGWYRLGAQHRLFCGDTALPSFVKSLPPANLAIAITTEDWAHDWLVEQADSVVILPEENTSLATFKHLLTLLSKSGDTVIFPWLPFPEMITVAHRLGQTIYAGDPDLARCRQAIAATNLAIEPLATKPAVTLAG